MSRDAAGGTGGAPRSLDDLAGLVRDARRHPHRRWSIEEAAEAASMSPMTWRRVEESRTVRGLTYSGVENALEWPNGSIRNYLAGGEAPAPVERPSRPANAPTIFEATWDQLLSEVDRRYRYAIQAHHRPKTDGSSGLVLPAGEETAESVRAQGMLPGRPMRDEEEDHASEDQTGDEGEDHASGGHT